MDLSTSVLGSYVAGQLRERRDAVLLRIGRDTFDRASLANVSCYNWTAAMNLSNILNRELAVKDTRDVFEHVAPMTLALPRLGAVSIAVLGAAFEAKGIGGGAPLEAWVRKHAEKDAPIHTFASLKHHDEAERAAERRATRARFTARRSKAHRLRSGRFLKRHSQRAS